jgi:hypothetical protein
MEPHGDPSPDEPGTDVPAPPPQPLGGVFHTYLGYDAVKFGSAQPADPGGAAKGAFEHLMAAGNMRRFTDAELAKALKMLGKLGPAAAPPGELDAYKEGGSNRNGQPGDGEPPSGSADADLVRAVQLVGKFVGK